MKGGVATIYPTIVMSLVYKKAKNVNNINLIIKVLFSLNFTFFFGGALLTPIIPCINNIKESISRHMLTNRGKAVGGSATVWGGN